MIALSIPLLLIAPFMRGFRKIAVGLFLSDWGFQFVGHAFEGRPPEFFKDWRFLLVGLRWWLKKSVCAVWEATPTPKRADDKNEKQLIEDHVDQTNELHSAAK